jgi:hypothetical protein
MKARAGVTVEMKTNVGVPVESETETKKPVPRFRRALEDPLALLHPKLTAQRDLLISQREELMAQKIC